MSFDIFIPQRRTGGGAFAAADDGWFFIRPFEIFISLEEQAVVKSSG